MVRKIFGFLLLGTGCAFAYTAYQNAPVGREDTLAEVTKILTNPDVASRGNEPFVTAPAEPTSTPGEAAPETAGVPVAVAAVSQNAAAAANSAPPPAQAPSPDLGWEASTTASTGSAVRSNKPGDASARYELVRTLQKELKRTGCYGGEAHGSWTKSSKRALQTFMDRVNASLPVDQPDYIQLSLLQSKTGLVCGADCPTGQSLANGRCVPNAIVAHANPVPATADLPTDMASESWTTTTTSEPGSETGKVGRSNVIASVEPTDANETLPWQPKPAANAGLPSAKIRKSPPPGRMAVGAPLPSDEQPIESFVDLQPDPSANLVGAGKVDQDSSLEPGVTLDSASPDLKPRLGAKAAKAKASKGNKSRYVKYAGATPRTSNKPRYYGSSRYSYRSVQNLFQHPLGRM